MKDIYIKDNYADVSLEEYNGVILLQYLYSDKIGHDFIFVFIAIN